MATEQEQAFAQFADFREGETPVMSSNVNTLDDVEEQSRSMGKCGAIFVGWDSEAYPNVLRLPRRKRWH